MKFKSHVIPYWLVGLLLVGSYATTVVADQHSAQKASPVLQVSPPNSSQPDVSAELYMLVQQLQQEVRELRGQIEELNYRVNQSSKQERERYIDLDRRILELRQDLDGKAVAPVAAAQPSGDTEPSPVKVSEPVGEVTETAQNAYDSAYNLIKQRQYDEAVTALHVFINDFPESDLTPNAYYWLGEVYLVLPKLEQARQSFIVVVGKYPAHRKASDALYKLGVTYHRLGNREEAEKYLRQTMERYPDSSAANLARDYQKQL